MESVSQEESNSEKNSKHPAGLEARYGYHWVYCNGLNTYKEVPVNQQGCPCRFCVQSRGDKYEAPPYIFDINKK